MTRAEFIEQVTRIIENVQMHACGIDDLHGADETPESAAKEIADLLPGYAYD